jgi:hypothetical protein
MNEALDRVLPGEPPAGWFQIPKAVFPIELGTIYSRTEDRLTMMVSTVSKESESMLHVSLSQAIDGASRVSDDMATSALQLFFPTLEFRGVTASDEEKAEGQSLARGMVGNAIDRVKLPPVRHFVAKV